MTGRALLRHATLLRGKITPVSAVWHGLRKTMFDPYRPERYYMRGPGPKSQAKLKEQARS
ncbi:hypothetical protein MXD81_35405 [Microbacteriaceae bacterium K1510]|nr:hypothetical protein [Microbacteriaceae bacterium K1510]